MKTPTYTRRAGFSLIELIVVMLIVAILAGVVAPRIIGRGDDARLARTISDVQTIRKAAELMYADLDRYPDDGQSDRDPGFADVTQVPTALRDRWRGPYLDRWPDENAMGGHFDWEYRSQSQFNFDGQAGNEAWLRIVGISESTWLDLIDEELDDGNRSTGQARHNGNDQIWFYVGEGLSW